MHSRPSRLLSFVLFWIAATPLAFAQPAAPADETPSLLEQAFALDEGRATPRNAAAAAELYAQAAATGDAFAHLRLGYLYETGDGVPQDYATARRHYQSAVEAGLKEAHVRLAICHLEGWGGPVDRPGFVRELRAGAEAGDVSAQRVLSSVYFTGVGVPKNEAEGTRWLELAARQGDPEAQADLGRAKELAQRRVATATNLDLARSWYLQSAEQEYLAAMRAMARTFLAGSGPSRNWPEARKWLQLASEGDDAEAPFILAVCELLHTDVVQRDVDGARIWLELASARGNYRATEVLQLEIGGRSLTDAVRYVLQTPFEDRYVQNLANKASDAASHPPVPYRVVKPIYPQTLSMTGIAGEVSVDFIVDTKGLVTDIKIFKASHPLFSERAAEAVQQWRFHPGRKNGRLVKTRLRLPIEFGLDKEQMTGIDRLLGAAYGLAQQSGPTVTADAKDLRMARPVAPLQPTAEDRKSLEGDVKALVLLVLDETGRPVRGHILQAEPAAAGPVLLQIALKRLYVPRELNGEKVPSNVVLPFLKGKYAHGSLANDRR